MISFEQLEFKKVPWEELDNYGDRTVFQTLPWLNFLAKSQGAKPVVAAIKESGRTVGYFTALVVQKFGLKILGSPFKGWTTDYMGFNLLPEISRQRVIESLSSFAFTRLGCHYMEMMDQNLTEGDFEDSAFTVQYQSTFEIDLDRDENDIYTAMDNKSCRWCIRKAIKSGVVIEEASDSGFAKDYYAQLKDVFAKQSLLPTYSLERVQSLISCLQPTGSLLLLRARSAEGECIGTGIFPAFNDTMYFWGGASWRSHQHLCPNELIMWHAMRYWKTRGIKRMDMGGGGEYKKKYGGRVLFRPRLLQARYGFLLPMRNAAQRLLKARQQILGALKSKFRSREDAVPSTLRGQSVD